MRTSLVVVVSCALWLACGAAPPVKLSAVSPSKGLASGGQRLKLQGSGFGEGVTVKLGGQPARVLTVSESELEVLAPRGVAGPASVEVSAPDSRSALDGGFLYEAIGLSFVDVTRAVLNPLPADGAGVVIVDLDGDGRPELLQAVRREGALVYPNLGGGKFGPARSLAPVVPAPPVIDGGGADAGAPQPLDVRAVVTGDFDADGRLDLFFCTAGRTPSQLWHGLGGLAFAPAAADALPPVFGVTQQSAVAADLDADGDLDLISLGASPAAQGAPQVMVLGNDGHGRFANVTERRVIGPAFDAPGVALGDLDSDGNPDLFFSGGAEPSRIYLGDGNGVFQRSAPDALPSDAKPMGGWPALGDLDADGTVDVFMPTATQDRVLFNDGTAHLDDVSTIFLGAESGASTQARLVDLDLDGALDVVVVDTPGRVRLYRNDGSGRLFDYSFELIGNDATLSNAWVAIGDVDGDGDDDFFVSRADLARPVLFFNLSPKTPVDGDLDLYPDAFDNCAAVPNRDQAEAPASPFGCRAGASCKTATGCDLKARGGSAYLFCRAAPLPWAMAQERCRSLGGDLLSISDAEENAFLSEWGPGQAWLGFTDAATEGTWVWASGEPAGAFSAWGMSQPDNAGNAEDCMALLGESLKWNDDQCQVAKAYICETVRAPPYGDGDACR